MTTAARAVAGAQNEATAGCGPGWRAWLLTTDHKRIGILYLVAALAAFLIAGVMALGIRIEQMAPGESGLINYFVLDLGRSLPTGTAYNAVLTFHGAAMILAFLIPALTGFAGNYLVPLMIGAPDVAFPRLNALSLWMLVGAIVVALMSFVVSDKPDVMWTGYPPYSVTTAGNTAIYVFIVLMAGVSSMLNAINMIVTIGYLRAPGMGWHKLNLFVWTTLAASIIQLLFVPVLAAAVSLVLLDKHAGTGFFDPARGGDVLLYQNLFWFYGHPAVYVIFLPSVGLLFDIIATQAKNRIFRYRTCVWGGIVPMIVMSADVWVHHLYIAGMPNWIRVAMMITTLMISIPVGLIVISLWGTLFRGAITYNVSMHYAVACLFLILVGGLTGIPLAIPSLTVHLSETSFVHAHFHFIMGLMATFALFAAVYHWFPKITGRSADTPLARVAFWLNVVGTQLTFWPLAVVGIDGMPRRYWTYDMYPAFEPYHGLATAGAAVAAAGMALMLTGWVRAARHGTPTGENPWRSASLEWTHADSPPGPGNFRQPVTLPPEWFPYRYT